jgi:protein involved in polysaccharide export with SLBB domain
MLLKKIILSAGNLLLFCFIVLLSTGFSQQEVLNKDQYQIGPDEKLLISVHIWGEVRQPGEYLVPDDTDILELISKAGGPTEYANLSNVKITRGLTRITDVKRTSRKRVNSFDKELLLNKYTKQVIKIDLKSLLDKEKDYETLPILQPGDVVRITRNTWFKWQTVIRVISQVAILVQVWYWYNRAD